MSYTEQEKQQALALYDETGSIAKVINTLGYPTRQNMYTWIKNRNIEKKNKASVDYSDTPEHRRHPSLELKLSIIRRCFQEGEEIKSVSEETGYSGASIYLWRRKYVVGGVSSLVSKKKHLPRGKIITDTSGHDSRQEELVSKIKELEMENDTLKETIKILKKDQGIDQFNLKNKEKTMIIDALRDKYSLSLLLKRMDISKSSYCYQHKIIYSKGKYEVTTNEIMHLFHKNDSRYGYRRIYALLKKQNIIISEKIVRRIMKENHLVVKIKKTKKCSSYIGEISKAAENLINRNFHSDKPNQKMLTDITVVVY
ncbi:IS3 family transposase [Thomasclavelia spiroformis]|uniref:IS3 family transposase n=1 Tax=Thomasclavelia spiroformis TaxID=29348 RepID=UPI000B372A46|nr:IS3 family transposase [Thomasclavelia spiroformis]OUQ03266.1 hypothetical protein B5E98_02525 [Thomasclavelia spiroformis]